MGYISKFDSHLLADKNAVTTLTANILKDTQLTNNKNTGKISFQNRIFGILSWSIPEICNGQSILGYLITINTEKGLYSLDQKFLISVLKYLVL